jgi:prepilin-type N-terminal cleavage/methylation domain-containing protein
MLTSMRDLRVRLRDDDEGFTLVELLVSLVVASVILSGVAYGVAQSLWSSRDSKDREVAANLAAGAIDQARATTDYVGLTGGTSTQTVNGETFTILRTVTSYSSLGTASPCDGTAGSFIKYKKIGIRVTWPRMKLGTSSVRAETLLAPGASSFDPTKGNIGAKVLNALGQPVEGIAVQVTGAATNRTNYTDDQGCAFFEGLTPGTFTVAASASGYVTSAGIFAPSQPASVATGATTPIVFDYDKVGTLSAALGDSSYPAPSNVPLAIGQTALLPDGTVSYAGTGTPRSLTNLFPFASGYTMWAGSCLDADPQGAGGSGPFYPSATRGAAVMADTTGSPTTVPIAMAKLRIAVIENSSGNGIGGATVVATHAGTAFCDFPGESFTLPATGGGGDLRVSMPWGMWSFTVPGRTLVAPVTPTFSPTTSEIYVEVRVA